MISEKTPKISILVVSLNPGEKLKKTVESILDQTYGDYEILIKDGGSSDGSLDKIPKDPRIRVVCEADQGIYDGMNRALELAAGKWVYFLNCGDYFDHDSVLEEVMAKEGDAQILYGNVFERKSGSIVMSNPHLDTFACYRNVPCHQACFYERALIARHPFCTEYRVRADYEQFLWCFLQEKAKVCHIPIVITSYEGGGFSETAKNRKRSEEEHRKIASLYMTKGEILKFRLILWLTLAPLRTCLAKSPVTSGIYNRIKTGIYSHH